MIHSKANDEILKEMKEIADSIAEENKTNGKSLERNIRRALNENEVFPEGKFRQLVREAISKLKAN